MKNVVQYAQLGVASGMRSTVGLSQLSRELADLPDDDRPAARVPGFLARASVSDTLQLATFGEMVADKLPFTPSRIEPAPLGGRVAMGALAGGALAASQEESVITGALIGGIGALLGTFAGYHIRRALTSRAKIPDIVVALCEDAVAIAVARDAVRT